MKRRLVLFGFCTSLELRPEPQGRDPFACAVEVPADLRFEVVYAGSRPARQIIYDPTPARELLGYEPRDTWPEGVEDGL